MPGPSPDPMDVSTAVLALLGEVSVECPRLMIAVDVPNSSVPCERSGRSWRGRQPNCWTLVGPGWGRRYGRRLPAEAVGDPLALQELPAVLSGRQRSGQDPLSALLPLSGRLEAAFASVIERLPARTRRVLRDHPAPEADEDSGKRL
ncbi:hypothetical protein [Streptomyces sp. NPDC097610]|uniref:hypothetical protein n=1 Tax=Streptomyces sp. NPDC097610 TaxID=3157227 RepID=UPI00331E875E